MLYAFFWVGTYTSMKMEQTERSETLAYKIQTPVTYPEESKQHDLYFILFCLIPSQISVLFRLSGANGGMSDTKLVQLVCGQSSFKKILLRRLFLINLYWIRKWVYRIYYLPIQRVTKRVSRATKLTWCCAGEMNWGGGGNKLWFNWKPYRNKTLIKELL